MRAAKVRRKVDIRNACRADARIGHLVTDQLVEFFADAFGDTLTAMRIQISG